MDADRIAQGYQIQRGSLLRKTKNEGGGGNKQQQRSIIKKGNNVDDAVQFPPCFNGEGPLWRIRRQQELMRILTQIDKVFDLVMDRIHEETFINVRDFVVEAGQRLSFNDNSASSTARSSNCIPTAVISSEHCRDDHDYLMETLSSRLAGLKGQQIFHAIDGEEMQSAIQLWDKFVDGRRRGMYQVFCFNHSERISPDALLQFLNVYCNQEDADGIIFLFGTANTIESFTQSSVFTSIRSHVDVKTFKDFSSDSSLYKFLETILMDKDLITCPGERVLQHIINSFTTTSSSVLSVYQQLKFAYIDFFYSTPLSMVPYLCPDELLHLTHLHMEQIRELPSFHDFIDTMVLDDPVSAKDLVLEDMVLVKALPSILVYWDNYKSTRFLIHTILCAMNNAIKSSSKLKLSPLTLLLGAFSSEFIAGPDFQKLKVAVKFMNDEQFENFAINLTQEFAKYPDEAFPSSEAVATLFTALNVEFHDDMDFPAFRANLQKAIVELLLQEHVPYQSKPLYELIFISNSSNLLKSFSAAPRQSVHNALADPGFYIGNSDGLVEEEDITAAYRTYLECGQLINLHDWFQSFCAVVTVEGDQSKANSTTTEELLARFIRSTTELFYCGFIKANNRKTDHVTRSFIALC